MAVRESMRWLISELRGLSQAGYDDYTIGTLTYWNDGILQDVLEQHRSYQNQIPLQSEPSYGVGSVTYTFFYLGKTTFEDAGTVQISSGAAVGTADYTFYPRTGEVIFNADTAGSALHFTGWTYDLYAAAGDVWRRKAAHYAERYDVATDNHNLKRSQLVQQALQMASYYNGLSGAASGHSIYVERGDC